MKKLSGFSLMEMMILLLIVSIIAGATAPIINKKLATAASEKNTWVWIGSPSYVDGNEISDIGHNLLGKVSSVVIGALSHNKSRLYINNNGNAPSLYLENNNNMTPYIGLKSSGDEKPMNIYAGNNSFGITNVYSYLPEFNDFPGKNSIFMGNSSMSMGDDSLAIGNISTASGANSIAIGYTSIAPGANSIAIGNEAKTFSEATLQGADNAIAIGQKASSQGKDSIAVGQGALSQSEYSIAVGKNASSQGKKSIAVGKNASSQGEDSIAIGGSPDKIISDIQSGNLGEFTGTIETGTTINTDLPKKTLAKVKDSIAVGSIASSYTGNSIAIGKSAKAGDNDDNTKSNAIAMGNGANAKGLSSLAIGDSTNAIADHSIAIGDSSNAQGYTSLALGNGAQAQAVNSIAIGSGAKAQANNSIAIGNNVKAQHENSVAIGNNAVTTTSNQIVLGDSNTSVYILGSLVADENVIARRYSDSGSNLGLRVIFRTESPNLPNCRFGSTEYTGPFSDRRLKNVGKAFKGGLEEIKKLEVFNYTFKKDKSKTHRVGVMAQDLEKIFPSAVIKGEDGFLRIRLEDIFYSLVNAIKELDAKIDILAQKQKKFDKLKLEDKVSDIEKRLDDLEKNLNRVNEV